MAAMILPLPASRTKGGRFYPPRSEPSANLLTATAVAVGDSCNTSKLVKAKQQCLPQSLTSLSAFKFTIFGVDSIFISFFSGLV